MLLTCLCGRRETVFFLANVRVLTILIFRKSLIKIIARPTFIHDLSPDQTEEYKIISFYSNTRLRSLKCKFRDISKCNKQTNNQTKNQVKEYLYFITQFTILSALI